MQKTRKKTSFCVFFARFFNQNYCNVYDFLVGFSFEFDFYKIKILIFYFQLFWKINTLVRK